MSGVYEALNDSRIILRNAGVNLGWIGSKIFSYKMKKNYSKNKTLVNLVTECLSEKMRDYFIEEASKKGFYEPLMNGKSVLEVFCTDPVTGKLCFGMIGNIIDLQNSEVQDGKNYGPFFNKKTRKIIKE